MSDLWNAIDYALRSYNFLVVALVEGLLKLLQCITVTYTVWAAYLECNKVLPIVCKELGAFVTCLDVTRCRVGTRDFNWQVKLFGLLVACIGISPCCETMFRITV